MAISFVAGSAVFGSVGTTVSTPTLLNTLLGDTIIVAIRTQTVGVPVVSMTDSAGNIYRFVGFSVVDGGSTSLEVWYCTNCIAHATNIITATMAGSLSNLGIWAAQFRGLATISPLDVNVNTFGSGTTLTSPVFSTAVANSVIIGIAQVNSLTSTWTPGSGFTTGITDTLNVAIIQYQIVNAIQSGITVDVISNQGSIAKTFQVFSFHEEISSGGGGEASMGW